MKGQRQYLNPSLYIVAGKQYPCDSGFQALAVEAGIAPPRSALAVDLKSQMELKTSSKTGRPGLIQRDLDLNKERRSAARERELMAMRRVQQRLDIYVEGVRLPRAAADG